MTPAPHPLNSTYEDGQPVNPPFESEDEKQIFRLCCLHNRVCKYMCFRICPYRSTTSAEQVLEGLVGRMRIYEFDYVQETGQTSNIVAFTELETVRRIFAWINDQIAELRAQRGREP